MAPWEAVVAALLAVGAVVLVGAGLVKLRDPRPTGLAIESLGVGSPARAAAAARVLGVVEVLVGATALVLGAAGAALLAVTYAGLLVVAERQRRTGETCGCFGVADATVGWRHVTANAVFLLTGLAAATSGSPALLQTVGALRPVPLLSALALALVGAWLVRLHLSVAAVRPDAS